MSRELFESYIAEYVGPSAIVRWLDHNRPIPMVGVRLYLPGRREYVEHARPIDYVDEGAREGTLAVRTRLVAVQLRRTAEDRLNTRMGLPTRRQREQTVYREEERARRWAMRSQFMEPIGTW